MASGERNGHAPIYTRDMFVEKPAYDWEADKRSRPVYDDGTTTFFWRAHRITVLVLFLLALVYVTFFEQISDDTRYNQTRGLLAAVAVFVIVGVTFMPDGPFLRPHPVFWRFILVIQILYQLGLVFILFQSADDARQMMRVFDSDLGKPLPEKSYGGNCLIYDSNNPDFPWHNLWDKMDGFVVVHFFGWWLKTLVLRDWWLCMVISVMFEVLEYSFEHQLPNFSECWWDHWLMDFLICNGLGIYLGMKTLKYLNMKDYNWRGMWSYPTYRGKLKRVVLQFTPHSWIDFDWRPSASLKRWIHMLCAITAFLVVEMNTFYLKWVLWLPPPHWLCLGRLVCWLFWGAAGMREYFRFCDDPNCKKLGTMGWVCMSTTATECFIVMKFDWPLLTQPLPFHISLCWVTFAIVLLGWTIWHFYINRLLWHTEHKLNSKEAEQAQSVMATNNNAQNKQPMAKEDPNGHVLGVSGRTSIRSRKSNRAF